MNVALLRYLGSDAARSQRWIAPTALFVAACIVFNTDAGPLLTTYADTMVVLFLSAIWITWVVTNSEDPTHASITATAVGGPTRLRLSKLLAAFVACAALAVFAVALPLALQNHPDAASATHVGAGLLGHLLVAAAGVAIGSLLMQPVIQRAGWAFVVASAAFFVEIVVPGFPPLRQVVVAFNADHPNHLARTLALSSVETAVGGAVIVVIALRVARARS